MYQTIEFAYANPAVGNRAGGYNVYEHDIYPESSVNAGMPRRSFLDHFDTVEEARREYPRAEAIEGSSRSEFSLPITPPSWFDPAYAGERWAEED